MKQYTTKEQTQHLIELGFPKPKIIANTEVEELVQGHNARQCKAQDSNAGHLALCLCLIPLLGIAYFLLLQQHPTGLSHISPFILPPSSPIPPSDTLPLSETSFV